jgi:hypothetical protein
MFKKDTTASLMGGFTTLIDKLAAVAKREQEKAIAICGQIDKLNEEKLACFAEANEANAAAATLSKIIGGAA